MRQARHPTTGSLISSAQIADTIFPQLRRRAWAFFAYIIAHREAAAMRNTLADLSEAQRLDIGVDAVPGTPSVVVDGALMRRLMAMR